MAAASILGLLLSHTIYPTPELLQSFMANDLINLFIGLPTLLGSMWLTRRGKLVGLLLWPGGLLYVLYNYIAYLFGMPFSFPTFVYLALVLLSAYLLFDILVNIDKKAIQKLLSEVAPVRIPGVILVIFGLMFIFRAISIFTEASTSQLTLSISEVGLLIADLVLSTIWIAGGVLLLRRTPLGYVSGLGLLYGGSMLFIGLIVFLLLEPVITNKPFALGDVVAVSIMGLVCFIPFWLYIRVVLSNRGPS